jgi:hypothetical protein
MSIFDLWLPIGAATLACFFMSFAIWTLFKWHNSDYQATEREEEVRAALAGTKPGYYLVPYCVDYADMAKEDVQQKFKDGPVAYVTIATNGMPSMAPKMVGMLLYFLVVSIICAYMVTRTLAPAADYLAVFRIAGTVAFIANGLAVIPESIWFSRPWSMTVKNLVDALIYAFITAGIFGWLA